MKLDIEIEKTKSSLEKHENEMEDEWDSLLKKLAGKNVNVDLVKEKEGV